MGNVTEKTGIFVIVVKKAGKRACDVLPLSPLFLFCFYFIDHVFDVYEVIISAVVLEVLAVLD